MKKHRLQVLAVACALALVSAFAFVGCSSSGSSSSSSSSNSSSSSSSESSETVELQIFAANSLQKALPEVQALYTEKNPNVTFKDTQFKASGDLVSQLKADANAADILITASTSSMDTASSNGSIDDSTRADMFLNDLVICAQEGSGITVDSVESLGTNDDITSIAIGEPNAVPAGKYALQSLETAGLVTYETDSSGSITNIQWDDSIASKMNAGADKVGTVASYVSQGQCDVGFVYTSDIYRYDGIEVVYTVPDNYHKNIKYPGAVCKNSQNAEVAADFLNFCMTDPDAQQIFSEYGFELAS